MKNPTGDRLFLDTGYVIARFNKKDQHHEAAKSLANAVANCRELWTTDAVLLELAAAFSSPPHRSIFIGLWDQFHFGESRFRLEAATGEVLENAVVLYRDRHDKSWSLTDCLSFVVMQRQGLSEALTPDQHFVQAGFRALLIDG